MNGTGILGWDSDTATWATLTVAVTITFSVDVTAPATAPTISGWDTRIQASGSKSKTYTFTRATFDPDSAPAANSWHVVGGHYLVGEPSIHDSRAHRCAGVMPTQDATGAPTTWTEPPSFSLFFQDSAESWDIDYSNTYTPGAGATPPANDTGTRSGNIVFYLLLSLDGGTPTWFPSVQFSGTILPEATLDTGATQRLNIPGLYTPQAGPDVAPETLKASGSINFGTTIDQDTAQPGSPFIGSATAHVQVVITCS